MVAVKMISKKQAMILLKKKKRKKYNWLIHIDALTPLLLKLFLYNEAIFNIHNEGC